MSPALRRLLAKRFMGSDISDDYVNWALAELKADRDTKSICILAGLGSPLDRWELEFYFERALAELGFALPEPRAFLRQQARDIAQSIVAGKTSPLQGCREICDIWVALEHPDDLERWFYLYDELEPGTCRELRGVELDAAIRREARALLTQRKGG